jgi:hypothetical protein
METLPEELLVDTFQFLQLYYMAGVRRINRGCYRASKEYSLPCHSLVRGSLQHWRKAFPKLTSLNMTYRTKMSTEEFLSVRDVVSLDMACCQQPLPADIFSTFSNLKVLDIQYCSKSWTGNINDVFPYLTGLTEFSVSDNHYMTDTGIRQLVNLRKLYIHNCDKITNEGLAPLTQLVDLDLYNMYNLTDELFQSLVNVTKLHMTFGNISTEGICHLKKLKWLYVLGCSRVSHCQGFQHLPLQTVHLSSCAIHDENMVYLSHVHTLSFYGVTYLQGTNFSKLTHAHTLSIFKLHIDKEIVDDVVKMPCLKKMYMYDCYISPDVKQELKLVLPNLHHN